MSDDVPKSLSSPTPDFLKVVSVNAPQAQYDRLLRLGSGIKMTPSNLPWAKGKFLFETIRIQGKLIARAEEMQKHLMLEGVFNYNMRLNEQLNVVDFYFSSLYDLNIARMAFIPNKSYEVALTPTNPDSSLEEIAMMMNAFQQHFELSGLAKDVGLRLDVENRKIWARAANRRALVDLIGSEYDITPQMLMP